MTQMTLKTAAVVMALAALTAIATIWLVNGVVWFARLHYRLLKPALDPQPQYQNQES